MLRPSTPRRGTPLRAAVVLAATAAAAGLPLAALPAAAAPRAAGVVAVARDSAPVVLTGAQLPSWSRLPATGVAKAYPSGSNQGGDGVRSAHNGALTVPSDSRTGVDPDTIAAFRWDGSGWVEVPVQVDQRFPYFLANGHSSFSFYSGTDEELTYAWNPDRHATGEEAWKKLFGDCSARYAATPEEFDAAVASGAVTPRTAGEGAPAETFADYAAAMTDPVPTLDDDDEVAFQASDAGVQAPAGATLPAGVTQAQQVAVVDPLDPAGTRFVYLGLRPGGSSFTAATGYVRHTRAADADQWIDRYSFLRSDPEVLGVSNTGYGPNVPGTVCVTAPGNDHNPPYTTPDGTPRPSTDRFPRDAMTIATDRYRLTASGRWMVRGYQVAGVGTPGSYGPDLIDRWKGRAFQQSPDSSISVVGFEDEQVNWEANSALLGWRSGPVRTIREVWGADSGTNVTRTETYYRDADVYRYHVRVHPIPPDGLYTSWDYNPGAVTTYYNLEQSAGVPIDGINDDMGQVDQLPGGEPAYFDAPDPTFDAPSAVNRPEEVAGPNGGAVYVFEFKGPTSATNADAVPYYRDDRCLDDGTGDAPVNRPFPGDSYTDGNGHVAKAYVDLAISRGAPADLTIDQLVAECKKYAAAAPWAQQPFQGAFASHGIHFFTTQDSDNATLPKPITEIDGQQWRFAVPMAAPTNVLAAYAPNVDAPLQPVATPYDGTPSASVPEVPYALLLPLAAVAVGGLVLARRRRADGRRED